MDDIVKDVVVSVAKAALSAAFESLFGKLSSQEVLKYARRNNVESEVKQWIKFLDKLKYTLDDAEERQMSEGPIKLWLGELRDLAYDVEDILDEFSYQVLRQKIMAETEASSSKVRKLIHTSCSCFSLRDVKSNVSLGKKMREITQRFEAITKEKESLNLTEKVTQVSNGVLRDSTSSFMESPVYGREKDKETLVNELLSGDSNGNNPISVVAIVGMGGLGKTRLAQLLHNDEIISRSFDIRAWVCVSDEFDVLNITVKLVEGLTSGPCDMKNLDSAQKKLKDAVQGKKFLLILDDVWNEDGFKWETLTQPLAAGGLGSKVLITTRNENVACTVNAVFMHRLKKLKLEECLSLLALHAFGVDTFNGHPSLQQVGEQIAKKCDGLPLAAKAIGGLLRGKLNPSEWETVLTSNMWELPRDKYPVMPALRVSYHYLPSHLKSCFAYCAIFPKDYEFNKDDLILGWMAQGFLEQSTNFMEVGNEYFSYLLSRSFFQPTTDTFFKGSKFGMHDLMNDLAMWVSGGICLYLNEYGESDHDMKFQNPRHLSFMNREYEAAKRFEKFPVSTGLRTFLVFEYPLGFSYLSSVVLNKVMYKMRSLKLLRLKGYEIKELPDSISDLKQLRHLDVSCTNIRLLQESICDLLNLQVLKLSGCRSLIELPRGIMKLINLRVLDIRETNLLNAMPLGIRRLNNLQILSKFIVGEKQELRLNELKCLPLLRGELSIWGLEKVVDAQEAIDADLKAKKGLVSLEFKWTGDTSGTEKENQVQVLEELQPCTSLKSLKIDGYNGKSFPKWVGDFSFTNLEALSLRDCRSARSLPSLGGLVSLKTLQIGGMHGVKKVGDEFLTKTSNSIKSFPSLETLIIEEMNGLEEWCFDDENEVVFPRLQRIEIRECPVWIGKLPDRLPLLGELVISNCPNLRNLECRHHSLRKLEMQDCTEAALKTLGDLTSLRSLKLENIRGLICLDDDLLRMLGALEEFEIHGCEELKSLVRNEKEIEVMAGLEILMIGKCDELVSFGDMRLPSSLKELHITRCNALEWLPEGFMMDLQCSRSNNFESALQKLCISNCPSLKAFPIGRFPDQLIHLDIDRCDGLESMPEFSNSIKDLAIVECDGLRSLPRFPASVVSLQIEKLTSLISSNDGNVQHQLPLLECVEFNKMFAHSSFSLESLSVDSLDLRRLPDNIMSFRRIKEIRIYRCENLKSLPEQIRELNCLRLLIIGDCPNLELLAGQDLPREIETLLISRCEKVIEALFARGLSRLASLRDLEINGGSFVLNIEKEAPLFLPKLQSLSLANIGNVEKLGAVFQFPSCINHLSIENCPKLRELPMLELSPNLGILEINECPVLKKRCLDRKGGYWPLLSVIPRVRIDNEDMC